MNRWKVNAFKRILSEYRAVGVPQQDIAALVAALAAEGPCDLYTLRLQLDALIIPCGQIEELAA